MSLEIKDSTESQAVITRLTTAANIAGTTFATTGAQAYVVDVADGKGTFSGTEDGNSDAAWTTDYIDVSSWTTGQITAYITVYDRVGNSATGSYSFAVDNVAPEIKVSSPANGEEKTGVISITGTTNDTGSAGASNIQWMIPTTAEVTTANGKTGTAKLEYLKGLTWLGGKNKLAGETTVSAWQFDFDGTEANNPSLETYDSATYASTISGGVYTLPVYFMATDSLGNYTIKQDFIIRHNPDGDKPKVTFTYPTTESYDTGKTYVTLGGTIVPTGTAEIPSNTTSVRSVYLQIADDNGNFNAADKTKAGGTYGLTVVDAYTVINAIKGTSYTSSTTFTDSQLKEFGFATKAELDAWWGIEVTGTASWRMQLNSDGKLNPTEEDTTNNIKIRACGVNANGKMGAWTQGDNVLSIHVDLNVPTISAVVNQYPSDVSTGNETADASQSYTADMFIKGQWYLVLDILDESNISAVEVSSKVGDTTAGVDHVDKDITATVNGKQKSGKRTFVKINKDATAITYTIAATEGGDAGSAKTTRANFSFKIDNTAPSLDDIKDTGDSTLSTTGENKVQNTNYIYTLKGESDDYEGGSGVEHIVFYYMRKSGVTATTINNQVVLDPMIKPNGSTYSTLPLTGEGALTEISVGDDRCSEKLYGKSITGTISANANGQFNTFTASSNFDEHVRVGGLIKVSGLFRKITSKSGAVITFTPPATSGGSSTALFPIAQVIDASNTAKSNSSNPFVFESGKDDGDGMVESFSKSGSKWTWDASIHSDNLPDGPATLVILAFDNAGNVSGKSYKMMVSNNAPRLSKVYLGTDLNRDGSYSESEFETYNIAAKTGNANGVELYSLTTAAFSKYVKNVRDEWEENASTRKAFTIKNGLAILPEILGGNGAIKLVFNKNDTTTGEDGKQTGSGTAKSGTLSGTNISGDYWSFASGTLGADSAAQKMSFTFWDATNECTQGTNSQYAFLRVNDFVIDQIDGVAPNVVVNPFFWNSATDNSLYGNSTANGHIELESDLTTAITTLYGNDPKVSGKIVLRGTAYDDTLLGELSFSMTNFNSGSTIAVAEYGTTGWTIKTVGNPAAAPTMATNFYEVSVEDDYVSQDGHKATWSIAIDTAHLSDVAHTNAVFTVIAKDKKTGTANSSEDSTGSDSGTTDATKHKPSYQMDVVPYITKLYTGISDSAGEEFARSANGKYIVRESETVKMYGFNLKVADNAVKIGTKNITPTEVTNVTSYINVPIGTTATSSAVSITVNGVESLNNINNNPTFVSNTDDTITAYPYNSQADGIANNRLTDDIELWIWTTSAFDTKMNTTNITSPMMKMDNNGNYYISYGNGAITYSIDKNGTSTDLEICYNKYHNTNVAFDSSGNFYGVGTNTDRAGDNINTQSSFTFFSRAVGRALTTNNNINANDLFTKSGASRAHYTAGSNKRRLELSQYGNGAYNINRVQRPKLTVSGDGTAANVYMAYYDASADNVKFRYGVVSGEESLSSSGGWGSTTYTRNSKMTLGLANDLTGNATDTSSATGYHLVADTADTTKFKAGAYTAVGYTKDGYAVVAWYDAKARRLVYSYNKTPATAENSMTTWQSNAVYLDGAYTGWYVDLVVDAKDQVHIAYYNSKSGDLKYVYIPEYDKVTKNATTGELTGGATVVTVDSYLSVGTNITINVRDEGTGTGDDHVAKYVPYIYYYNTSNNQTMNSIKVAWQKDTTLRDGTINDKFTGAWESMTIPTQNIPVDATVCGGVPTGTHDGGTDYSNTVLLSYMTDAYYEKAYIKGNIK